MPAQNDFLFPFEINNMRLIHKHSRRLFRDFSHSRSAVPRRCVPSQGNRPRKHPDRVENAQSLCEAIPPDLGVSAGLYRMIRYQLSVNQIWKEYEP
jgi:hypothetical protein